jgi:hypothetical protein
MASERIGINHRVRSPILMSIDQSQLHRQPTVPRPLGASFNVRAEDALGALAVGERWNVRAIVEPNSSGISARAARALQKARHTSRRAKE